MPRGGHVLGVCNGFQILTEAGLLPGALLRNAGLRFLSMDCHLRVERADTAFTAHYQRARSSAPRWRTATATTSPTTPRSTGWRARAWWRSATPRRAYPEANRTAAPAPSPASTAPNLRVLGLMPHPEDLVDPLMGGTDGKPLFDGLAA